jgi:nucleoid-associated protein YgaU
VALDPRTIRLTTKSPALTVTALRGDAGPVVAQGDSLTSIAARDLGDYSRWPEIAALNGIRDPDRLTVGQTVRLP